jgi:ribonuclease P protein component
MLVLPSQHRRLGITVSRRVGNAVHRNRVKRLVREVFRRERALFPEGCDVVVVARSGADALDYAAARAEIAEAREAMARVARRRERR